MLLYERDVREREVFLGHFYLSYLAWNRNIVYVKCRNVKMELKPLSQPIQLPIRPSCAILSTPRTPNLFTPRILGYMLLVVLR